MTNTQKQAIDEFVADNEGMDRIDLRATLEVSFLPSAARLIDEEAPELMAQGVCLEADIESLIFEKLETIPTDEFDSEFVRKFEELYQLDGGTLGARVVYKGISAWHPATRIFSVSIFGRRA